MVPGAWSTATPHLDEAHEEQGASYSLRGTMYGAWGLSIATPHLDEGHDERDDVLAHHAGHQREAGAARHRQVPRAIVAVLRRAQRSATPEMQRRTLA